MRRDVCEAISADLAAAARTKRRHFAPAIVGVGALIAALLAMAGVRGDFAAMPGWRPLALGASWVVCGLLFPAVGVGLWFPRRRTRIALAAAGLVLPLVGLLGWPLGHEPTKPPGACGLTVVLLGAGLVGIGALSGAFAQRCSAAASVAAGLALAALSTTTWICPVDEIAHLTWGHVLPAAALMAAAIATGRGLHRRQRA